MDDVLLTKYILQETTGEEAAVVRRWIAAHPDNEKHYSQLRLLWDASQRLANKSEVDEQEAWQRFVHRREQANGVSERPSKGIVRKMGWLRIAAVLVLGSFAALSGYYFLMPSGGQLLGVTYETVGAASTDTLADGSVVTLSQHASLRFSEGLFRRSRLVDLHEGEVFFKVTPHPDKPFVISSGKVTVTVLGTSFHVTRNGDETAVSVESGKVKVEGLHRAIALTARQKVTINTSTQRFEIVLERTPLWRVVEILGDAYGVEVTIARDEIKNLPMTTILDIGRSDDKLQVIAETLGVTVEKRGNKVIFK